MPLPKNWRRLQWLERWQIVRVWNKQTVAAHSHAVARLTMDFYERLESGAVKEKLDAVYLALTHDEEEAETGDIPSTTKPRVTGEKMQRHEWVVRFCDLLEAAYYVKEEKMDYQVVANVHQRLREFIPTTPADATELTVLTAMMAEAGVFQ